MLRVQLYGRGVEGQLLRVEAGCSGRRDVVAQLVQASSIQPSAARAGFTPRPNQLWNTSCSRAGTDAVVAPSYSMPRPGPHTKAQKVSPWTHGP